MREYMDWRVTSPTWGLPLPCKQALRACLHEGGGPPGGEVTRLGGGKKLTLLYMQSYNPAIPGYTF